MGLGAGNDDHRLDDAPIDDHVAFADDGAHHDAEQVDPEARRACSIRDADFQAATFTYAADFEEATFRFRALFDGARVGAQSRQVG